MWQSGGGRRTLEGVPEQVIRKALGYLAIPEAVVGLDPDHYVVKTPRKMNNGVRVYWARGAWKCHLDSERTDANPCGHILSVLFFLDIIPKPGQEPVEPTVARPRDWPAIEAARVATPRLFPRLLNDLVRLLDEEMPAFIRKRGRPPRKLSDKVFEAVHRVYERRALRELPGRMTLDDLAEYMPHGPVMRSALSNFLDMPGTQDLLERLLLISAAVAAPYEDTVHVDGTAFTPSRFHSYHEEKHKTATDRRTREWIMAVTLHTYHTQVVPAVVFAKGECPQFIPLMERARLAFELEEAGADKAYRAWYNYAYGEHHRIDILVPPDKGPKPNYRSSAPLRRAFQKWEQGPEAWMKRYHKRSNIESANHALKFLFEDTVYSRGEAAQRNEILCKLIAYNLRKLIELQFRMETTNPEFKIDFRFAKSLIERRQWIPMHVLQNQFQGSATPRFGYALPVETRVEDEGDKA